MKVLFFLAHSAYFHLFKNIANKLNEKNHECLFIIKEKDILEDLLKRQNINYFNILPNANKRGKKHKLSILVSSGIDILKRDIKLINFTRNNRPDILIGTEASLPHVGKLLNIPSIIVNEDDAASQL